MAVLAKVARLRRDKQISKGLIMEFEFLAYRLVGSLPVFCVMMVGVWLAFQHRWRNSRVCTLVGIALSLEMGSRIVLPILQQLVSRLMMDNLEMGADRLRIYMLLSAFFYSATSAVVWGLVLFAIFGRDGIVRSSPAADDDYE